MNYENPPEVRVYGEWEFDNDTVAKYGSEEAAAEALSLPARLTSRWNGWAVPAFAREQVDELVRRQSEYPPETGRLTWDGDAVVFADGEGDEVRVEATTFADEQRPYWVLNFGWTWDTLEFDDPAEPSPAQKRAFEGLRATLGPKDSMRSGGGVVEADGSHRSPVRREVSRETMPGGGTRVHTQTVRTVRVTRLGLTEEVDTDD